MKKIVLGILICLIYCPVCFGSRAPSTAKELRPQKPLVAYVTKNDNNWFYFAGYIKEFHLTDSKNFSAKIASTGGGTDLIINAHTEKAETWAFIKTDCAGEHGREIRWVTLKIIEDQSKANTDHDIWQPVWYLE